MRRYLIGDAMKCTGCRICEVVCSFNKEGVIDPSVARIHVERFESGEDRVHTCRQCTKAACLEACPEEAIYRDDEGVVQVDEAKAQAQQQNARQPGIDTTDYIGPPAGSSHGRTIS